MEAYTHFGYKQLPTEEKAKHVSEVFTTVASSYDVMNDLMSFALHRLWKRHTVLLAQIRPGQHILDCASGTGDVAKRIYHRLQGQGLLTVSDINADMLHRGRDKLIDACCFDNVIYCQADVQRCPFATASFDKVTMAFGLRNVTDKQQAMQSIYRILKPGGVFYILEFSKVQSKRLGQLYDWYSFTMIPRMGKLVASSEDSYQYLVESIRMHPDQETLQTMLYQAGFDKVKYHNILGGVVALHCAIKY